MILSLGSGHNFVHLLYRTLSELVQQFRTLYLCLEETTVGLIYLYIWFIKINIFIRKLNAGQKWTSLLYSQSRPKAKPSLNDYGNELSPGWLVDSCWDLDESLSVVRKGFWPKLLQCSKPSHLRVSMAYTSNGIACYVKWHVLSLKMQSFWLVLFFI